MKLKNKIKTVVKFGFKQGTNSHMLAIREKNQLELQKMPQRSEVINFLLSTLSQRSINYLEIGVRHTECNFDLIKADVKFCVDPGVENEDNPADFKLTSDAFFTQLDRGKILDPKVRFDLIFIDGLHVAAQVDRDIENALRYLSEDGFIVLHDCNPPSEWHTRSERNYRLSPAEHFWNGTTWKAFVKWRQNPKLYSCCIDTDWGVGILSRTKNIGKSIGIKNTFYDYQDLDDDRIHLLNLMSFQAFKDLF